MITQRQRYTRPEDAWPIISKLEKVGTLTVDGVVSAMYVIPRGSPMLPELVPGVPEEELRQQFTITYLAGIDVVVIEQELWLATPPETMLMRLGQCVAVARESMGLDAEADDTPRRTIN